MKKLKITLIAAALTISWPVHANDTFTDDTVTVPFSTTSSTAIKNLNLCFQADMSVASSKSIRACSKAYRASAPHFEVRSEILTRRGLLQLSVGRFDKAGRDFSLAARLNGDNEFAFLGQGYAAILQNDYEKAEKFFKDCSSHGKAYSLAQYGLAITKELQGDFESARKNYEKAVELRPDWIAPKQGLSRLKI